MECLLKEIKQRFAECKLSVHETKTKIVNIRGSSGFTIQPHYTRVKGGVCKILPRSVISKKSVTSVLEKFKAIHKRRTSIEELARELNPVIRGVMNYYCKFWSYHTQSLWHQLNRRLQKWVQWETRKPDAQPKLAKELPQPTRFRYRKKFHCINALIHLSQDKVSTY